MRADRSTWLRRTILTGAVLCIFGCATLRSDGKPQLSVEDQAEALAHFSMGVLAAQTGDSAMALDHFQQAIRIDPGEATLYPQAIASALRLHKTNEIFRLCESFRSQRPEAIAPLLMHAEVSSLLGQPEKAEHLFREAAQRFPDDSDAILSLVRYLVAHDKTPEAITLLEQSGASDPPDADSLALLGSLHIGQAQNLDSEEDIRTCILEGIDRLEQSVELDSGNPQRLQQLGYAYLAVQNTNRAVAVFEDAAGAAPGDTTISRQLLQIYTSQGQVGEALRICEKLMRQTATEPEVWTQYLMNNLPDDKRGDLAEYLQQTITEHADAPLLYYIQLSTLYMNNDQLEDADRVLSAANRLFPSDSRLRPLTGYLLLQQKQYPEAYDIFSGIQQTEPDAAWASSSLFKISLALSAQKTGRIEETAQILSGEDKLLTDYMRQIFMPNEPLSADEAAAAVQAVQTLQPDAVVPLYFLSLIQSERNEYEDALLYARQFETQAAATGQTNLLSGMFYYQFASMHERAEQLEEAERLFRKAIELGPALTAASAQNYIAYMWAERGEKLDMSLQLILQALETDPDNPAFIDTLGWIYYMQGNYKQALSELQKAGELLPDDPAIWEHIGDTYLKMGDRCAAVKHWEKAAEFAPDGTELLERIEKHSVSPAESPVPTDSPADTPAHP